MKKIFFLCLLIIDSAVIAQRPATRAEHDEDARVVSILSAAMPKDLEEAPDPEERSYKGMGGNSSDLTGVDGFHNNMNFSTRDVFNHYYKADYNFRKVPAELEAQLGPVVEKARQTSDLAALEEAYRISNCTIIVSVNQYSTGNGISSYNAISKFNSPISDMAYRDSKGQICIFYFGKVKPALSAEEEDGPTGGLIKKYAVDDKAKLQIGTTIQTIAVSIEAHPAIAEYMLRRIDWKRIKNLLGTGQIKDDESESELKKYFVEKPVPPVAGNNFLSFTYIDENGKEQEYHISSSKHDLSNCALLINHHENPRVLQEAHIDFRIQDDKDINKVFTLSLPIIRTTGTIIATFDSDYDYQVMWRGNSDADHSFSPETIEIKLLKWAPVGDFLEGSFSGTATLKDHNDFSTEKPKYVIKNGKFRIRRIADQIR